MAAEQFLFLHTKQWGDWCWILRCCLNNTKPLLYVEITQMPACSGTVQAPTPKWVGGWTVTPCQNPIQVILSFSQKNIPFERSYSQTHHFICPNNFGLYCSWQVWCPFIPQLRGEKVLTWTLVPWILCHWRESADANNCLIKKSQQWSEIKRHQHLMCFLKHF